MPHKDYEHEPYMGLISRSEPSGRMALFGSEVEHSSAVTITISKGSLARDLSRDWYFGEQEYIEVTMSHAQWATFVSTGRGQEIPCTIQHLQGQRVEQPEVRKVVPEFENEVGETLRDAIARLEELKSTKLNKTQQGMIDLVLQEIESNIPFVMKSAKEHVETFAETAKVEVECFMEGRIKAAGLEALMGQAPIMLDHTVDAEAEE